MNNYLAQYWRNDGGWHGLEYDMSPILVFQAESDEQARGLALAYIDENRLDDEDFSLEKLARFDYSIQAVPFKGRSLKAAKPNKDLEAKLDASHFTSLDDAIRSSIRRKIVPQLRE
jgi:hypothetical protein